MVMKALWAVLLLALLTGCPTAPRHQKGGGGAQTLGPAPMPPTLVQVQPRAVALKGDTAQQVFWQPENPEGPSVQKLVRTITTTAPTGEVVTTVERAETQVGGSQSLADIAKQVMGAEHWKNMAVALLMAGIAWALRKQWPTPAGVLALGAIIVAFFGIKWALAVGGLSAGVFLGYHLTMSGIPGVRR
jgi:hypothetical protein